jgi:small subunit ribosomal protein S6
MATKNQSSTAESVVLKDYESVIIFTPVLSEDQLKDAVSKYRSLITENGGELVHEENWGLTKLAYPIQKKTTGFYILYEFRATPEFISKFELAFRRDERILRFLTIALDKHGIKYNQDKRAGLIGKNKDKKNNEVEKVAE